jgi:uncharacterized protein YdeI (YjbR/CyaY-like superfamily)
MSTDDVKAGPEMVDGKPVVLLDGPASWDAWLDEHGTASPGVWLRIAKKGAELRTCTYAQALEVALTHGWIDGQKKTYDGASFIQKFTPRGPRSMWSQINRDKAEALIRDGRMNPGGLAAVERAKANGQWDAAYESFGTATVPADLQAALDANPAAKAFFEALDRQNRYAVLFRIHNVKKAETRARKIEQFVAMLAKGETLYPRRNT